MCIPNKWKKRDGLLKIENAYIERSASGKGKKEWQKVQKELKNNNKIINADKDIKKLKKQQ